jgi:hypothetical protein
MSGDAARDPEHLPDGADKPRQGEGVDAGEPEQEPDTDATRKASKPGPRHEPNPPYTTEGWLTTPEFGAAGSGGAEYEPGPETD